MQALAYLKRDRRYFFINVCTVFKGGSVLFFFLFVLSVSKRIHALEDRRALVRVLSMERETKKRKRLVVKVKVKLLREIGETVGDTVGEETDYKVLSTKFNPIHSLATYSELS